MGDGTCGGLFSCRELTIDSALCFSFLADIDRIAKRDYVPSDEDVMRARLRTLGVQEHKIHFNAGAYLSIS